jgi:signal transduction histidine kinase
VSLAFLSLGGWAISLLLCGVVLRLRRRLRLVARASHELRGPATAIGLATASLRREPGGPRRALAFEAQLERMQAGLADLELARSGRRARPHAVVIPLERLLGSMAAGWRPVIGAEGRGLRLRSELGTLAVRADRGRLVQALANLLANAAEHGSGTVELCGRRAGDRVVLEVRDEGEGGRPGSGASEPGDRGHGLGIATSAVEEAGGSLSLQHGREATVAALELPALER